MNELQVFDYENNHIRTIVRDGEPWFVGKDVATALGYERATKAVQIRVDDEDKDEVPIQDSIGRMQKNSYYQRKRFVFPYLVQQAAIRKEIQALGNT